MATASLTSLATHQRLGVGGEVFQNGTGRFEIQGGDTLGGCQGGVGNSQEGINSGLVGGGRCSGLMDIGGSLVKNNYSAGIVTMFLNIAAMQHMNMNFKRCFVLLRIPDK